MNQAHSPDAPQNFEVQLERGVRADLWLAQNIPIVTNRHQKAETRLAHCSLSGRVRRSGQLSSGAGGGPRRIPSVLRQQDTPCGRNQVPNDRESGISPGTDREEDAPILPKP